VRCTEQGITNTRYMILTISRVHNRNWRKFKLPSSLRSGLPYEYTSRRCRRLATTTMGSQR